MLEDVAALLRCPVCSANLVLHGRTVRCAAGHTFDVARQGYVNLLPGGNRPRAGDTSEMVAARDRFLSTGHYLPISDAVVAAATTGAAADRDCAVLDVGAGTGWYLGRVLDGLPPSALGIALDLSRYAVRRAARCHRRAGAVVADTWGPLPVRDGVVDVVLDVFAPRNAPELHRVLRPGGHLVVVTPMSRHLAELRRPLGLLEVEPGKEERLAASLEGHFDEVDHREVDTVLRLSHDAVTDVVAMGPSAWHGTAAARTSALAGMPAPLDVTASVRVAVYRRR